ncbi:hypothetical protein ACT3SP_08880 [Brachybacterium sp. AOP43-C2-M15]|uniref:hypothetical protein n=1 Tax=Brachybacterium sp. AOP43-C2-M15 TaxID=3457661 RepID=UPI0040334183
MARRGLATKRTYGAAAAAVLGMLASAAMTVVLVGAVIIPSSGTDPDPVVAGGEPEELDGTSTPAAEEETTSADEPTVTREEETTTAPAPDPEPTEEPTHDPSPAPTVAPDLSTYEELDERTLAQIVKAPDDHIARQVIVYGRITQLDAATGKCVVRVSISHAPQDDWYDYEHNTMGFAGDGESDCPVLDPFVADDEVKLWVTLGGSLSYDTQIGGSTTVPAYLVDDAELL